MQLGTTSRTEGGSSGRGKEGRTVQKTNLVDRCFQHGNALVEAYSVDLGESLWWKAGFGRCATGSLADPHGR
ncbi:hypothetical protein AB0C34_23095 [Nocardia sp. NPDC049220]|uniref:hypothetical protein n=1 Tax=Nocardia sp. NPDC049220 TaxID=3155273 RepID=UPI0033E826CC